MRDKIFVDTNIFVYLQSLTDISKREISREVIDRFDCVCSTQVLSETSNVLLRKGKLPHDEVVQILDGIVRSCELVTVSYETIRNAHRISKTCLLGYYDSLIIAAALESECEYLFSEDLSDGQKIDKQIQIVNIYRHPELLAFCI